MESIHDQARGRWRDILLAIGIPSTALTGKHGACPLCSGGTDRWRWDDRGGNGSFFCTHCGSGSGVDLVMKFLKVDFRGAKAEILKHLPSASIVVRKASQSQSAESAREYLAKQWARSMRLDGMDPASRYLQSRGLSLTEWPSQLRYISDACYKHDDGSKTYHPAMLAKFVGPDVSQFTLHITYLDEVGRKALLPKIRKLAPCPVPPGGAVRLAKSGEVMGIAEGIETALSASLLHGVPVWAALSSGAMMKWKPPVTAKTVVVFADNDVSYTGQVAAYSLAYSLTGQGVHVEVCMPPTSGCDWNDILLAGRMAAE